jgi:3-hydroxyisobutyrate dehydrogenase-like beta-hydroxyacid dehydrogenase
MSRTAVILYPGDMGSAVGAAMARRGWRVVSCLTGRSARTVTAARSAGIAAAATLAEAVSGADLVISLVPQTAAVSTAGDFAQAVADGRGRPAYVDANSVAPATMTEVCDVVERAGCTCVDGAFVGQAALLADKTTLYLSGERADEVAASLADALRVTVLGSRVGLASAFKLASTGFSKGLVSLFLEMLSGAERVGLREELLLCLRGLYPGTVETVERLLPSYPRHLARRVAEAAEYRQWLSEADQIGAMVAGTEAVLERFAALGLDEQGAWTAAEVIGACLERDFLAANPTPRGRDGLAETIHRPQT